MCLISGLGQIPKVAFVLDTEYLYLQQMDQLFAELEKQPGKGSFQEPFAISYLFN